MPVPDSAIAKYREVCSEAEGAFAASRELHESWRTAYDHARGLADAAEGRSSPGYYESVPDLRRLEPDDPRAVKVRQQLADAQAEARRRDEHARRAREKAQELGGLRDACFAELRRRGVPESRLNPRTSA
jgi:hypothetical protein